jgi:hypothetical protein
MRESPHRESVRREEPDNGNYLSHFCPLATPSHIPFLEFHTQWISNNKKFWEELITYIP